MQETKNILQQKISKNQEIVGIVGLGYVGLPLAISFAEAGIRVIGFDKNQARIDKINGGENYIKDVRDAALRKVVEKVVFEATADFSRLKECDAILICVPTPLDQFRKPDMSYIEAACRDIGKYMKAGTFISLESTTYPTTTENLMLPIIEQVSGLKHGKDFWLAFSPERVDPGNSNFHTKNTPKVLGALDETGREIGEKIYSKAIEKLHIVSSPRVAEMVKILENTYRLINISLINELTLLAGKMNIDIWEVIEAAKTKPFGFQAFFPGPGVGGHCIPLDPFYLEHIAKSYDFDLSMIHAAGHINMRMPHYMYIKIATALNKQKKSINGSKILFLGIAYKPDIDDDRESPILKIMDIVTHKGGEVSYYDPFISSTQTPCGNVFMSVKLDEKTLSCADAVVIATKHQNLDAEFILKHSKTIIDLQNLFSAQTPNVYKL